MIPFLLLSLVPIVSGDPPFLFPHGYFDSNKIKPFDAMYLNLMAASNLEYGGTTVEELDELDANRKKIPRPPDLQRNREEDDPTLDRKPTQVHTKEGLQDGDAAPAPKSPFSRIRLLTRRMRDEPVEDEGNPFEDIATRAPPRSYYEFQRLKKKLRHRKKSKKGKRTSKTPRVSTTTPRTPTTSTVPPTLIPSMPKKAIHRLPNNPYKELDMTRPNIIPLPVPPEMEEI